MTYPFLMSIEQAKKEGYLPEDDTKWKNQEYIEYWQFLFGFQYLHVILIISKKLDFR